MAAINLASFQSPGVYVKEVASQIKAIAGVSTSTAAFIGISSTTKVTDNFTGDGSKTIFDLTKVPAKTDADSYTVKVGGAPKGDATLNKSGDKYTLNLKDAPAKDATITVEYELVPSPAPTAVLCTNFGEFKKAFWDLSNDTEKNYLAHAVYGFFNNGGGRCYVICADTVSNALAELARIDEISLVAAPGKTDQATQDALIDHCETQEGIFYRVAILDGVSTGNSVATIKFAKNSKYAALYFPWIKVADPKNQKSTVDVPPSGHIAGIYARVDTERGVHKAPANEPIRAHWASPSP